MLTDEIMSNKFAVLGHPLRLSIMRLLMQAGSSGLPAGQMGKQLKTAPNAMTFHLQKLHHAGLVTSQREGQFIIYLAKFADLLELANNLLETCCAGSLEKCGAECPSNKHIGYRSYSNKIIQKEI